MLNLPANLIFFQSENTHTAVFVTGNFVEFIERTGIIRENSKKAQEAAIKGEKRLDAGFPRSVELAKA
jgi:hypothetical protein